MADILYTIFSMIFVEINGCILIKMIFFNETISQHKSRNGFVPNTSQAITWTNGELYGVIRPQRVNASEVNVNKHVGPDSK